MNDDEEPQNPTGGGAAGKVAVLFRWIVGAFLLGVVPWLLFLFDVIPSDGAKRLAAEKAAYVGTWASASGPSYNLVIDSLGRVRYNGCTSNACSEFGGRIIAFDDHGFTVLSYPFLRHHFAVSVPPHANGESFAMAVDARPLVRVSTSARYFEFW